MAEHTEIAFYKEKLTINPAALDNCVIEHPRLADDVSERVVYTHSEYAAAKDELKRVEARRFRELYDERKEAGLPTTVAALDHALAEDPERCDAFDEMLEAEEKWKLWRSLRGSYADRGYSLRLICEMQLAGMQASQSAGRGNSRAAQSEANYKRRREQLEKMDREKKGKKKKRRKRVTLDE